MFAAYSDPFAAWTAQEKQDAIVFLAETWGAGNFTGTYQKALDLNVSESDLLAALQSAGFVMVTAANLVAVALWHGFPPLRGMSLPANASQWPHSNVPPPNYPGAVRTSPVPVVSGPSSLTTTGAPLITQAGNTLASITSGMSGGTLAMIAGVGVLAFALMKRKSR